MELTRIVSSRLALPESLAEKLLASRRGSRARRRRGARARRGRRSGRCGAGNGARGAAACSRGARTPSGRSWRCASPRPQEGARALADLDLDEHFSSELLRRAARHLRDGRPARADGATRQRRPGAGGRPRADGAAGRAGRRGRARARRTRRCSRCSACSWSSRASTARSSARAARSNGDVSDLAERTAEVKREFDRAYERVLEETGEGADRSVPGCSAAQKSLTLAHVRTRNRRTVVRDLIRRAPDGQCGAWIAPRLEQLLGRGSVAGGDRAAVRSRTNRRSPTGSRNTGWRRPSRGRHAARGGLERHGARAAGRAVALPSRRLRRPLIAARRRCGTGSGDMG